MCKGNSCGSQVTCYDWDSDGSHDLIGIFTTSLGQLMEAEQRKNKVSEPLRVSAPYSNFFTPWVYRLKAMFVSVATNAMQL